MSKNRKGLPVKEGWWSKHPLTQKRIAVVPEEYAFAHIKALRDVLNKALMACDYEPLLEEVERVLKETE